MARGWRFDPPESVEKAKDAWLIEAIPLASLHRCALRANRGLLARGPLQRVPLLGQRNGITRPQQKSTFKRNLQSSGFVIGHGSRGDKVKGLAFVPADRRPRSWPFVAVVRVR